MRANVGAETTQQVLADNENVLDEIGDGTRLVEIEDTETNQQNTKYRIETAFDEEYRLDDARRAKLWYALYALTGGFSKPDRRDDVPLAIALEGRPAVATYMYAVGGHSSDTVADTIGVVQRTVWDYLSEIRSDARELGVDP